jgi:hypothetical protein
MRYPAIVLNNPCIHRIQYVVSGGRWEERRGCRIRGNGDRERGEKVGR